MCQFFSGIAFKNGDFHYNPMTDSHEHLIEEVDLKDMGSNMRNWVRFEYTADDLTNIDKYNLKIDELSAPDWCDSDWQKKLVERIKPIVVAMILIDVEKKILIGGCWILGKGSIIKRIVNARIILMENSTISKMLGTSKVSAMWGTSTVSEMFDNSKVSAMRGNSKVSAMWGNSTVSEMWGNSTVSEMFENSKVSAMRGNSTVSKMRDNSKVSEMWGNSTVSEMHTNSQAPRKPIKNTN